MQARNYGLWLVALGSQPIGQWLEIYDPDMPEQVALAQEPHGFTGPYGGFIRTTSDPARAKLFPSMQLALEEWRRVSTRQPERGDGRPNRPLSAFTITPKALPSRGPDVNLVFVHPDEST